MEEVKRVPHPEYSYENGAYNLISSSDNVNLGNGVAAHWSQVAKWNSPLQQTIDTNNKLTLAQAESPIKRNLGLSRNFNTHAGTIGTVTPTASVDTEANLNEKTLGTILVPANTLGATGMALWVRAYGTTAANGNAKTIRLKFGTYTVQYNNTTANPNGAGWQIDAIIACVALPPTPVQSSWPDMVVGGVHQAALLNAAGVTQDTSQNINITLTGQNGVATAGDIQFFGMIAVFLG